MPTCPICGGELDDDTDDREYHFDSYIYCKNDSDHITVGVDITKAEYEKLKETYFRIQSLDDGYVVDNGNDLIRARWKRRNREAQLKRTIAKYKKIGKGWQQECMKERAEYQRKVALWRSRAYAADLSFAAVWAINEVMNSAYMQDVEGS